jgi:hypothetical protein
MRFAHGDCNEQLYVELKLPDSLRANAQLNPIGGKLIYELSSHAALIPHPYHHADYPDRSLSFYVGGKHFAASELIRRDDGPDRVEIWFEDDTNESTSNNVCKLLEAAIATLHGEAVCSIPVIARRKQPPKPRKARPPIEVIPKLNKFCDDVVQFEPLLPELKELTIQATISSVLLPEEIESLRTHLAEFGWGELSHKAQDLVKIVFDRTSK